MVKTYIRAPNWSTAPPPDGPLRLGHLLPSLEEFSPINPNDIVAISKENPVDTKTNLKLNLQQAVDGELTVFARFLALALAGLGINTSLKYGWKETTELSFETFDTLSFNANEQYIEDCMKTTAAETFMKRHNQDEPLYLVTGLKVGRKGSITTSEPRTHTTTLESGLKAAGNPVEAGSKVQYNSSTSVGVSFTNSSDFIVAFQVKKIWFRKGQLSHELFKDNAELHGSKETQSRDEKCRMSLEISEDISALDFVQSSEIHRQRESHDGSEEEISWIIPMVEE